MVSSFLFTVSRVILDQASRRRLDFVPKSPASLHISKRTSSSTMTSSLKLPSSGSIRDNLVWIDCEMTGLDIDNGDTLIEIAAIVTNDELEIIAETPSFVIHQPKEVMDKMGEWCTRTHGDSGLTQVTA